MRFAQARGVCGRGPAQRTSGGLALGHRPQRQYPDQFRAAFDDSGLRIIRLAYNCGDKRLLPVLEKARKRFRRLDRFTTVSIYAVFAV